MLRGGLNSLSAEECSLLISCSFGRHEALLGESMLALFIIYIVAGE